MQNAMRTFGICFSFSARLLLALSVLIPISAFFASSGPGLLAQASIIPGVIALSEISYGRIFS
jgi:hypothetical protein